MGYLEKHSYHTQIINLAVKMLKNLRLVVEELLVGFRAKAFELDLHLRARVGSLYDGAQRRVSLLPQPPGL